MVSPTLIIMSSFRQHTKAIISRRITACVVVAMLLLSAGTFLTSAQSAEYTDIFPVNRFEQNGLAYSHWLAAWITLEGATDKNVTEIVIPDSVDDFGRWFPVVECAANAFRDFKQLKKIKFNKSIGSILVHAFSGCSNLQVIEIPQKVPPTIGKHIYYFGDPEEVFEYYHFLTVAIVVPPGCEAAYRNAKGWSRFKTIISHQPTADDYDLDAINEEINRLEQVLAETEHEEAELLELISNFRKSMKKE